MINQMKQTPLAIIDCEIEISESDLQPSGLTDENSAAQMVSNREVADDRHGLVIKPGIPNIYYFDTIARAY